MSYQDVRDEAGVENTIPGAISVPAVTGAVACE